MKNRLGDESSLYLRQHAGNPVAWQPWGDEAFELAEALDRPVFLSIGYSSCHWCHVMEEESFSDEGVAALLNGSFVCVKVDREERPDVDDNYMRMAVAMTGSGGWPLNLALTPEGKPFFAATYIPRTSSLGRTGLLELLPGIARAWRDERERLLDAAGRITSAFEAATASRDAAYRPDAIERCYDQLRSSFDAENGGFGGAPRFPSPHNLLFLMRYWKQTGEPFSLEMALKTLDEMRKGGICDHLGGGFHRYSTDASWTVPHFEKMLYDQAMLALAYLEAFQATGSEAHEGTACGILDFVLSDMTSPEGPFFSSIDADSEDGEGAFYLWTRRQIAEVLSSEQAEIATAAWGVTEAGNFVEPFGRPCGLNVLTLRRGLREIAGSKGIDVDRAEEILEQSRLRLLDARRRRPEPSIDEKVLSDWNGLMISALARAGWILDRPDYTRAAGKAFEWLAKCHFSQTGELLHTTRSGSGIGAFLDDFAFLVMALLELYRADGFDPIHLERAIELQRKQDERLWSDELGGYLFSDSAEGGRLLRSRPLLDGAIPSGNSIALSNLLGLWSLTGRAGYGERAQRLLASADVRSNPSSYTALLEGALQLFCSGDGLVISAGDMDAARGMLEVLRKSYSPHLHTHVFTGRSRAALVRLAPFLKSVPPEKEGSCRAYLCRGFACGMPIAEPARLADELAAPPGKGPGQSGWRRPSAISRS